MEENRKVKLDEFQEWAHKWGRIGTLIALVYMIVLPFIVLAYYDCVPSIGSVFNVSTLGILAIYIPVGFSEALSYTPILGCSAYLAFITGNIMNLKLPCAVNSMKLAGKEANTPTGEVVASIGVATCSIVTVSILTLAAIFATVISPVFEHPVVQTMSSYLLPALFGSMTLGLFASTTSGTKVVKGGIKGVIPVLVIVSVVCVLARIAGLGDIMLGLVGFLILAMLPAGIITSRILWKKGIIKVVDKE